MTRKAKEIDVSGYRELISAALDAFARDVSYVIGMANAAVTIENKRDTWRKRLENKTG